MKYFLLPFFFLAIALVGCEKDEVPEPVEETPVVQEEQTFIRLERRVRGSENWTYSDTIDTLSCTGPYKEDEIFKMAVVDSVFLGIVPQKSACYLSNRARTPIKDEEITTRPLDELTFEFTYTQLTVNDFSEVWLRLHYGKMELEIDLADVIRNIQGVVKVEFENNMPVVYDNGDRVTIDFNSLENEHRFTATADPSDNFFETELISKGTLNQTFLKYKFIRITSFGVE